MFLSTKTTQTLCCAFHSHGRQLVDGGAIDNFSPIPYKKGRNTKTAIASCYSQEGGCQRRKDSEYCKKEIELMGSP